MVPPTLAEVGQLCLQGVLQHLKHDAQHRAQPPVSQNQCLHTDKHEKVLQKKNNKKINKSIAITSTAAYCCSGCIIGGCRNGHSTSVHLQNLTTTKLYRFSWFFFPKDSRPSFSQLEKDLTLPLMWTEPWKK